MKISQVSPLKFFQRSEKKLGTPKNISDKSSIEETVPTQVELIFYNKDSYTKKKIQSLENLESDYKKGFSHWLDVSGLQDAEKISVIGNQFGLNHLLVDDILHTRQRPKYELYDETIFIVLKMFRLDAKNEIIAEQVSIVIKENLLATFQEREGDVFGLVRSNIKEDGKRIRSMSSDYLAYALLDAIIDNYFNVLEELGERIEAIEQKLLKNPTPETLREINSTKQESMLLRRSLWPLRDVINRLELEEIRLVKKATRPYFRDVYGHVVQAIETIESYRDVLSGMVDLYLSSVSNKMNAIMKVLTIIATIFIPLTFFAGIYGMNFKYMPELDWEYGYYGALFVMFLIALAMISYFHKKKWF